tara:strand:- start:9250 stop:9621 length:372 start_codon:yes stop_codon:yes gene_type:complete
MSQIKSHKNRLESDNLLPLSSEKQLLRFYYAGKSLPSPTGGTLIMLRVYPEDDGSASIILECNSSSLRYLLSIKKSTRTERQKVKEMIKKGEDPKCPRHVSQALVRADKNFMCQLCGISFGKF